MIIDTINEMPLAITEAKLNEINIFLHSWLKGENVPILEKEEKDVEIIDNVAVVYVEGVLARKMNLLSNFSGGTSTEMLGKQIKALDRDKRCKAMVLCINSPGGTVDGINVLSDVIKQTKKPIVTYTDGQMASAAYWISAGANSIIADSMANVGSIGVVATHYDYSEKQRKEGIKQTNIYRGKYKRIAAENEPLSDDGKQYLQEQIDKYHTIFVKHVADNRQLNEEQINEIAQSKIYMGEEAVTHGLIDAIGSLEDAIETAKYLAKYKGGFSMTIEEIKQEYPEQYKAIFEDGYNAAEEKISGEYPSKIEKAVQAERARCADIVEVLEDLVALSAIQNGTDTGTFFKQKLIAERQERLAIEAEFLNSPDIVTMTKVDNEAVGIDAFNVEIKKLNEQGVKGYDAYETIKIKKPELYTAWLKEVN